MTHQPNLLPARPCYNFRERLGQLSDGESFIVHTNKERVAALTFAERHRLAIRTEKVNGQGYRIARIIIGHQPDFFDGLDEESR